MALPGLTKTSEVLQEDIFLAAPYAPGTPISLGYHILIRIPKGAIMVCSSESDLSDLDGANGGSIRYMKSPVFHGSLKSDTLRLSAEISVVLPSSNVRSLSYTHFLVDSTEGGGVGLYYIAGKNFRPYNGRKGIDSSELSVYLVEGSSETPSGYNYDGFVKAIDVAYQNRTVFTDTVVIQDEMTPLQMASVSMSQLLRYFGDRVKHAESLWKNGSQTSMMPWHDWYSIFLEHNVPFNDRQIGSWGASLDSLRRTSNGIGVIMPHLMALTQQYRNSSMGFIAQMILRREGLWGQPMKPFGPVSESVITQVYRQINEGLRVEVGRETLAVLRRDFWKIVQGGVQWSGNRRGMVSWGALPNDLIPNVFVIPNKDSAWVSDLAFLTYVFRVLGFPPRQYSGKSYNQPNDYHCHAASDSLAVIMHKTPLGGVVAIVQRRGDSLGIHYLAGDLAWQLCQSGFGEHEIYPQNFSDHFPQPLDHLTGFESYTQGVEVVRRGDFAIFRSRRPGVMRVALENMQLLQDSSENCPDCLALNPPIATWASNGYQYLVVNLPRDAKRIEEWKPKIRRVIAASLQRSCLNLRLLATFNRSLLVVPELGCWATADGQLVIGPPFYGVTPDKIWYGYDRLLVEQGMFFEELSDPSKEDIVRPAR